MTPSPGDRRSGLNPALSTLQSFALLQEAVSARNLMRDAVEAIRDMRFVSSNGDSVFALGSIGMEKTMKILLGCAAVEETGLWPTRSTLKTWGHDVEDLHSRVLTSIHDGLARTAAPGYSGRLAMHLEQRPILPLLFATFARYGKSGRFHHLDILATDSPGELDEPSRYWERVELHVQETLNEFQAVPFGDNAALDAYEARVRAVIASELDGWWFCLHRLGVQGCFGELGKKIGWEIWEHGRPQPQTVDA